MIYRKRIDTITWHDVLEFCGQRPAEGATLDYKQDFPADLAKTLAAMANTLGGLVLIGVSEDAQSRPQLPPPGIPFARGLSERVTNTILDSITPPFFPEVQVAVNAAGDRCFVVIRIEESDETPHAVRNNTRVYLRTGNRNQPEDLATVERIGWLQNRRAQSLALRERLLQQAEERFERAGYFQMPLLTLALSPLYPREPFATPPALIAIARQIEVRDYYGTSERFPIRSGAPLILQDGVEMVAKTTPRLPPAQYRTELNTFGMLWYRQTISRQLEEENGGARVIRESEIVVRLDEFFDSARQFYECLGYRSSLHFTFDLRDIRGEAFGKFVPRGGYEIHKSADDRIWLQLTLRSGAFEEAKNAAIFAVAQKVSWAFGEDISPRGVNAIYRELKRVAVLDEP